jgi:type IV secretory pathway protease TraF
MIAVPAATAFTTPPETVALVTSLDDHLTLLFAAFAGATVAFRVKVPPSRRVMLFWSSVTPVTATDFVVGPIPLSQADNRPNTAAKKSNERLVKRNAVLCV